MDAAAAERRLQELAAQVGSDEGDLDALAALASDAVGHADSWSRAEVGHFLSALRQAIAAVEARRDAVGSELGGLANKGRAIRGYGRPMGVAQGTVAQRVYRRG